MNQVHNGSFQIYDCTMPKLIFTEKNKRKARYHYFIVLKAPPSNLPRIKQQSVPIYEARTPVVLCSGFIIKIGGIYRTRKKTNVSL